MSLTNTIHFKNLRGDLFGVVSGVGPVADLYGAVCVGFFAALFGGTLPLISEPTGPIDISIKEKRPLSKPLPERSRGFKTPQRYQGRGEGGLGLRANLWFLNLFRRCLMTLVMTTIVGSMTAANPYPILNSRVRSVHIRNSIVRIFRHHP
jgi:hypothetical protein